uniref:Cathepsin L n=1 Tax=Homo sapiens TaxID=9606 RepID=A0A7I2V5F7_HUMAN
MNPTLILAAFCLGIASATLTFDHSLEAQWTKWKAMHNRLYGMIHLVRMSWVLGRSKEHQLHVCL